MICQTQVDNMDSNSLTYPITVNQHTKSVFLQYLYENPNSRRVSQAENENLIRWLTDPDARPSSQKEFSRRHYVQKTFIWDEESHRLLEIAKNGGNQNREVVTEDRIAGIVEMVHERNGHAGWDATWKDVSSSYYGILRADVIFLLKMCDFCAGDPRKRPKGLSVMLNAHELDNTHMFGNLLFDTSVSDDLPN
jgi:hypothetical protein